MVETLFTHAVTVLGGRDLAATGRAYADLEAAYLGRAYHNLRHIEHTLETYLFLAEDLDPEDGARVVLALNYHDVVYDPQAKDNEAQSAAFARRSLVELEEADLMEIERLILLTHGHRADDLVGALVVDADLAILQASPQEYDAYAAAIRQEYGFVSDEDYRAGRTRVLEELMARKLFTSPLLDEDAARANMRREIERLAS